MTKSRFTEEFKDEAIKQVIERGIQLTMQQNVLAYLPKVYTNGLKPAHRPKKIDMNRAQEVRKENLRLKAELQSAKEDRDTLKKPKRTSPSKN